MSNHSKEVLKVIAQEMVDKYKIENLNRDVLRREGYSDKMATVILFYVKKIADRRKNE